MSDDKRAQESAEATLEHIKEAMAKDDSQEIEEMPLSVEVRSGWESQGSELKPSEFNILLSTGGPACRIYGGVDEKGYPYDAEIQYQDWFTPWESLTGLSDEDDAIVQAFAERFIYPY